MCTYFWAVPAKNNDYEEISMIQERRAECIVQNWTPLTPVFVNNLCTLTLTGFMLANKSPWRLDLLVWFRLFMVCCVPDATTAFDVDATAFGSFFDAFVAGWSFFSLLFTLAVVLVFVLAVMLAATASFTFFAFSGGRTKLGRDTFTFFRAVRLRPSKQTKRLKALMEITAKLIATAQMFATIYRWLRVAFRLPF